MSTQHFAVILAGGKGERFWPLSTAKKPKQLLDLIDNKPLITHAVERLKGLINPDNIFIITNSDLVEQIKIATASASIREENIIGEPEGKDTAAAIALATSLVANRSQKTNSAFCVLTADHIIKNIDIFKQILQDSLTLAARENILITIGIKPTEPNTGFGYIEASGLYQTTDNGNRFFKAHRFVEKPNKATAEGYLAKGNFYWNSGMFIWSVESITNALKAYAPKLYLLIESLKDISSNNPEYYSKLKDIYKNLEKISIDYAIMEKANNVIMAEGSFIWDDVGSWTALRNHFPTDNNNNIILGQAELLDCKNNIVISKDRLTAMLGVDDLVIVHTDKATLICHKDKTQEIKKLLKQINEDYPGFVE